MPGRPQGYDVNAFASDFTHIAAAMPGGVPVAGPSSFVGSWLGNVGTFLSGAPRVGLVSLHEYPFEACALSPSSPDYPTISRLLSPVASTELASGEVSDIQAAHARHLPVSIDEMNAVSCGNPPRLANSFALALWVVDALFAEAAAGVDSVEVHTWPGALYQLFTVAQGKRGWDASVYPEYYGLLLFSQATPPGSSLVRSSSGNTLIRAWATRGPGKAVRVALINDDPAAQSPRLGADRRSARDRHGRVPSRPKRLLKPRSHAGTPGVRKANEYRCVEWRAGHRDQSPAEVARTRSASRERARHSSRSARLLPAQ